MRSRLVSVLSALVFLLCTMVAQAQKVKVEYDKKADFTQYKTYTWMKLGQPNHPLILMDIVGIIDNALQARGLKKVPSGGDLLVNGYGSMDDAISVSYNRDIYAMPGLDAPLTWEAGGTPAWAGNGTSVQIDKGTLVVDVVDRKAKQLKWRGTAKANLDPTQADKSLDTIDKGVEKMMSEFPGKP
jgi:hypothetical protein